MEVRQFRYFIGIVDAGSFSRAAQVLHIAQPALSQQIALLEDELGCSLLERNRVGIRTTHQGEIFYRHAQQILKSIEDVKSAVQGSVVQPVGRVCLGLPQSTAQMYAMPLLERLLAEYPGIELEVHDEISGNLVSGLLQSKLDLAIVVNEEDTLLLDAVPIADEELFFVSRTDLMPADTPMKLSNINQYPLVLPSLAHGVRSLLEQVCQKQGLAPLKPRVTANSINIMRRTVLDGVAHSIMPWAAVAADVQAGVIFARPLSPGLHRRVCLCRSKDTPLTRPAQVVYELLTALCLENIQRGAWRSLRLID